MKIRLFLFLSILIFVSSCRLYYPNRMFQPEGTYTTFSVGQEDETGEYRIKPGDQLDLKVFSKSGFKLVDVIVSETARTSTILYEVRSNGMVQLPVVGWVKAEGYTEVAFQDFLAGLYAKFYNEPFVMVNITNNRVFVFFGNGRSTVYTLNQDNTSLLEVLAATQGITDETDVKRVRIIRGTTGHPEVMQIDLSTLEGMRSANLLVKPNDVIYVESRVRVARKLITETAVLLSLVTSLLTFFVIFNTLRGS